MIIAPSSPERAAQVLRDSQALVACRGTGGDGRPRLGVPARRVDGSATTTGNGIVALAGVAGAVSGDAAALFYCRDMTVQVEQNPGIAGMAPSILDRLNSRRLLVPP